MPGFLFGWLIGWLVGFFREGEEENKSSIEEVLLIEYILNHFEQCSISYPEIAMCGWL